MAGRRAKPAPLQFDTCNEAIHGALRAKGLTVQWLRRQLGKGFSFYQTLEQSHGMRLADQCFRLLGVRLIVEESNARRNSVEAAAGEHHRRKLCRGGRGTKQVDEQAGTVAADRAGAGG